MITTLNVRAESLEEWLRVLARSRDLLKGVHSMTERVVKYVKMQLDNDLFLSKRLRKEGLGKEFADTYEENIRGLLERVDELAAVIPGLLCVTDALELVDLPELPDDNEEEGE